MKKLFSTLAIFLFFTFALSSQVNVGLLNGPSCLPCAHLIENCDSLNSTQVSYEVFASPQELLPKMIKNEIDIGFMPVNVAAKSYEATKGQIICLSITGQGNLCLISSDKKVTKLKDLKGKKVYVAGQGSTPEYITKYLLEQEKIEIDTKNGVTLDFSIATPHLVPQFLAGKIENIIIPEPFVTLVKLNKKNCSIIDLQKKYFIKDGFENYPLTVMVATKQFVLENSEVLDLFLQKYEQALNNTLENPKLTSTLCEKHNLGLKKEVVEKSIPNANYVFIPSVKGKTSIENLLKIIFKTSPTFLSSKLPDKDFYYKNE